MSLTYNERVKVEAQLKEDKNLRETLEDYLIQRFDDMPFPEGQSDIVAESMARSYNVESDDENTMQMINESIAAGYELAIETIDRYGLLN